MATRSPRRSLPSFFQFEALERRDVPDASGMLSSGRFDFLNVDFDNGVLDLGALRDLSGSGDEVVDLENATFVVPAAAQTKRAGGPSFDFLGAGGKTVWVLPQVAVNGLLSGGLSGDELGEGDPTVTVRLVEFDGPGEFALWRTDHAGKPTVFVRTDDGVSAADALTINPDQTTALNWGFTAPGTYTLTFQASAPGADGTTVTSDEVTYTFLVQDGDRGSPPLVTPGVIATGAAAGAEPRVKLVDPETGEDVGEVLAFERSFTGGVRVAVGDVTGDDVPDLVVGAGAKGGPVIKIFDGATLKEAFSFAAYEESFRGGVFVAVGDVNGDDKLEILAGTGNGGGPRVRIFETTVTNGTITGVTPIADFFAYEESFRGGVQVAAGDVDDDGTDDVITGTGVGGGPRVQAFSGKDRKQLMNFFAFEDSFRNGVQVAAGDVDGDRHDDVIAGAGLGGGPRVRAVSGDDGKSLSDFFAFDDDFRGGVWVGTVDSDGDGKFEIVVGSGDGDDPAVRRFDNFGQLVSELKAFLNDARGVVAAGDRGRHGDDDDRDDRKFEGTVTSVTPAAAGEPATITIETEDGETVTVTVTDDTRIERNDDDVSLSSLLAAVDDASDADDLAGDRIEVKLDKDGEARKIELEGDVLPAITPDSEVKLHGTITAIDDDARTITLESRSGQTFVVTVDEDAKIEWNDAEVTFAALAVGDRVTVKTDATGEAVKVDAETEDADDGAPLTPPANAQIEGRITAIDLTGGTITVRTENDFVYVITVPAGATVERDGETATLSELQEGDRVEVRTGATGQATQIEAQADDDEDDDDDDDDGGSGGHGGGNGNGNGGRGR